MLAVYKLLREHTGASILDARAAYILADGDVGGALRILRAQGTIHGFPHSLPTEVALRRVA